MQPRFSLCDLCVLLRLYKLNHFAVNIRVRPGKHDRVHQHAGIREHRAFSVNLPSEDMMVVTDHIGMVSGRQEDKSGMFDVFYGELDTAPMIEQCKVTMELKLIEHIELPTHDLFVGEVVGTYADVGVLTNGIVDIAKLKPLLFDMSSKKYWSLGEPLAKCWSVGKEYEPRG